MLRITYEYAAVDAVCRGFFVTPLEAKVFLVDFSNLQDIFVTTKSFLGIFLASF